MGDSPDDERDDEFFKEVYGKEYTGPPKLNTEKSLENNKSSKRLRTDTGSDEEQQERDPNAVPTDFTSREARVWEAKSKAIERNWKRKKEEESICKICGESGHFTQGCPTTLGANRSREFVEKITVKDKRMRPRIIGSGGSVIQKIEKDTGCKIRIEDSHGSGDGSFIVRIAAPDRLCLLRGTDAVKKLINDGEDDGKGHGPRQARSDQSISQRQHSRSRSPRFKPRYTNEERHAPEHHFSHTEGRRRYEGGSSHGRNSPNFPPYSNKSERNSYQRFGHSNERNMYEGEKWSSDARPKELEAGYRSEQRTFSNNLDDVEQGFSKEMFDLFKAKSAEEDEENIRHRERMKELRENFQKSMQSLRAKHVKESDDFMRRTSHILQRQYQQQMDRGHPGQLDRGHAGYPGIGNSNYATMGGGVGAHGAFAENSNVEQQQGGRFAGSYDVYQGPGPNDFSGRAPFNSGAFANPQPFRQYR